MRGRNKKQQPINSRGRLEERLGRLCELHLRLNGR
jgi:hypothetical protein